MMPEPDRQRLLRIAREAILAHVHGNPAPITRADSPGLSVRCRGAFVTLRVGGELRGCIGHIEADSALTHVVARCAVAACSADPRFPPVTAAELPSVEIEVSLLGVFEQVSAAGEIEIGRHGLLIEQGGLSGLLLPQVAIEWNWDQEQFLAYACRKAGLPRDAWKRGAIICRFEAEVFSEKQSIT